MAQGDMITTLLYLGIIALTLFVMSHLGSVVISVFECGKKLGRAIRSKMNT